MEQGCQFKYNATAANHPTSNFMRQFLNAIESVKQMALSVVSLKILESYSYQILEIVSCTCHRIF